MSGTGLVTLYCDNKSTIQMLLNPTHHDRTKHIDINCQGGMKKDMVFLEDKGSKAELTMFIWTRRLIWDNDHQTGDEHVGDLDLETPVGENKGVRTPLRTQMFLCVELGILIGQFPKERLIDPRGRVAGQGPEGQL